MAGAGDVNAEVETKESKPVAKEFSSDDASKLPTTDSIVTDALGRSQEELKYINSSNNSVDTEATIIITAPDDVVDGSVEDIAGKLAALSLSADTSNNESTKDEDITLPFSHSTPARSQNK